TKTFTAALAVLFVAVLCYQVSSSPVSPNSYGPCCVRTIDKPLPLGLVVKSERTGSHCSPPAVIFTTIKDKLVCADPYEKWVKEMMNHLMDKEHSG
ncbi:CCL5 protein, partial [Menura novaehollandiae]|nr:CCL5 protein [Menura novaehollandiae]